jgi:nitrite reductase/ring-hydroxylating ferredoxin subunit/uncharacterized membrane protein
MRTPVSAIRRLLDKVEATSGLDAVIAPVNRTVDGAVRGWPRDFLHGVWLGHPLHPVLVQVPVGAWLGAGILDVVPGTAPASTVLVGAGTAAAVPAAAAGWTDWSSLAREQQRVGLVHAGANIIAVGLQAGSLVARLRGRDRTGRRLSLVALAIASAGAYIGGHLSYRQAAGVSHAAPQLRRISGGWHQICEVGDLANGQPVVHDVDGVPVMVIRDGETVTAIIERCAHQGGPLSEGKIDNVDGSDCVVCPWHGSVFRLRDGLVVHGPAATDQPLLRCRVQDGRVEVGLP